MKINNVSANPQTHICGQSFKSVYPVYHWVTDAVNNKNLDNTTIASGIKLNKKLQGKLVRILNSHKPFEQKDKSKLSIGQKISDMVAKFDADYKMNPIVRTFYNLNGGFKNGEFEPIAYLVTGWDVKRLENMATGIGILKGQEPYKRNKIRTAELNLASNNYYTEGLRFVKSRAFQFSFRTGNHLIPQGFHTNYSVIRNSKGEVKDFEIKDGKYWKENWEEKPYKKQYMQLEMF